MGSAIDLGRLIKQFTFKWVKLNSEILSGGVETLIKLLEKELVRSPHARKTQKVALKIALGRAKDLLVDGYIMDGKMRIKEIKVHYFFLAKKPEPKKKIESKPEMKTESKPVQEKSCQDKPCCQPPVPQPTQSARRLPERKINFYLLIRCSQRTPIIYRL